MAEIANTSWLVCFSCKNVIRVKLTQPLLRKEPQHNFNLVMTLFYLMIYFLKVYLIKDDLPGWC